MQKTKQKKREKGKEREIGQRKRRTSRKEIKKCTRRADL
jgi:hypothetical protein